jgi:3-methyladenine DNA glycosylase AlkD
MSNGNASLPSWVLADLQTLANPERKEVTSGYFPTSMEILGVPVPDVRRVARKLKRELNGEEPERVLTMAFLLHETRVHECRQAAYELLEGRRDARALIKPRTLRALGKGNDNWASVDAFSVMVAGPVWREGQVPDREVISWTRSKDRWWRRSALVSTVALNMPSRGGTGDADRTLMVCDALVNDPDPMVGKGLSWALRALIPVDREGVESFLERNRDHLLALVRREVGNKLKTGKKNPNR